ncbi:hypothetical protein [Dermacoccus nishinomiyaensis]|uniref:hypothetical protein n=1 Tax=Dermacoccus nishinomiyaensis TaxID=1274 RepID=UPI001F5076EA|nr:hypothetical protein [Dermacoccus nishinomiyaensis]MCI0154581.1 hypothetical protein [Dermacoccus nishinomiyaensis]
MKSLKAVTTKIGSGATPRGGSSVYVDQGAAFIRSQNVLDMRFSDEGLARIGEEAAVGLRNVAVAPGDVLVNITGDSVARVAMWTRDEPAHVSQHVAIVRCDAIEADSRYMQYWLCAPAQKARMLTLSAAGASRPALTKGMLEEFPFGPHSLPEQRAIAEVLGALDDKIAANRQVMEGAQTLAKSLVARLTTHCAVSDVAVQSRSSVNPLMMDDAAVRHYSLPAFDAGAPEVVVPGSLMSAKNHLQEPAVLVAKLNPRIPRIWAVPRLGTVTALASPEFVALAPRGASVGALWAALAHPSFTEKVLTFVAGTTGSHQRVKPEHLLSGSIPDIRQLSRAEDETVQTLVDLVEQTVSENEALAKTRDELLPLLMSGRITVKDAEKRVEGVV